jgi:hypothetical protein
MKALGPAVAVRVALWCNNSGVCLQQAFLLFAGQGVV